MTFVPIGRKAEAKPNETILDVARRAGAPIANSCGGVGVCARCRVHLVDGPEMITPPTTIEQRMAHDLRFGEHERLACQAVVLGDCSVTTTYW